MKSDDRNFDGSLRTFYRIRVAIDVSKPLKKGMKLKKNSGEWSTVEFRYERLPTFCFLCGIIGPLSQDVTNARFVDGEAFWRLA